MAESASEEDEDGDGDGDGDGGEHQRGKRSKGGDGDDDDEVVQSEQEGEFDTLYASREASEAADAQTLTIVDRLRAEDADTDAHARRHQHGRAFVRKAVGQHRVMGHKRIGDIQLTLEMFRSPTAVWVAHTIAETNGGIPAAEQAWLRVIGRETAASLQRARIARYKERKHLRETTRFTYSSGSDGDDDDDVDDDVDDGDGDGHGVITAPSGGGDVVRLGAIGDDDAAVAMTGDTAMVALTLQRDAERVAREEAQGTELVRAMREHKGDAGYDFAEYEGITRVVTDKVRSKSQTEREEAALALLTILRDTVVVYNSKSRIHDFLGTHLQAPDPIRVVDEEVDADADGDGDDDGGFVCPLLGEVDGRVQRVLFGALSYTLSEAAVTMCEAIWTVRRAEDEVSIRKAAARAMRIALFAKKPVQ